MITSEICIKITVENFILGDCHQQVFILQISTYIIINQIFICIFTERKKRTDNEQTETDIQKTEQRQPF